ncbi:MAG: hypothetical protein COA42_21570 [Alteromonadaceae bacterium]|nr:MAG: hypothetical protein COA42_21570 [Alteromonadaceae bacterium]
MLATMPKLEFNIRSFHPEKDFGWSGLKFEGDNRGFSNKPSDQSMITSRIWHRYTIDTGTESITNRTTLSDRSKAPWSNEYKEYNGNLKPKGLLMPLHVRQKNNITYYKLFGSYGGVNHAMPGSATMQKTFNISYVPTLDVNYKLRMDVDKHNKHIDIVIEINGDGFPNCEAFVVDAKGTSVFLGTHVRKGAAPTSLAANANIPMIVCAIRLPINSNGLFGGTVGDEWARVKNRKNNLKYVSIMNWNMKFTMKNPNQDHCMALERLSLEGCF